MSGNMPQEHVQRLMSAFEREDLVTFQMRVFITVVDHFSYGKELNTELRTCLLPFVDDPTLPVIVRMDVRVGEFHHVRMAQAREGTEDEGIPVNARSVIGELDIHDSLQFRS